MNTHCIDCKQNALFLVYMVHDTLWRQHTRPDESILCVLCFEKRVGRRLTVDDFTRARCNKPVLFFLRHFHNGTLSGENIQQLIDMQKEAFHL